MREGVEGDVLSKTVFRDGGGRVLGGIGQQQRLEGEVVF
jgi:hypothetical protein